LLFQKEIPLGVDYFKLKNDTLTFSRDFAGTTGGGSKLWIRKNREFTNNVSV